MLVSNLLSRGRPCSFRIGFGALEAFCNDDGTRSFMAVSVEEGRQELCRAIRAVDRALRLFGLPAFHQVPASRHDARAWCHVTRGFRDLGLWLSGLPTVHLT